MLMNEYIKFIEENLLNSSVLSENQIIKIRELRLKIIEDVIKKYV